METGNARNGRPQPAIHYRDRADRWQSDRPAISALAIYRSGDLEIFAERLVARPAKWCASSDEIAENAVNEKRHPERSRGIPLCNLQGNVVGISRLHSD